MAWEDRESVLSNIYWEARQIAYDFCHGPEFRQLHVEDAGKVAADLGFEVDNPDDTIEELIEAEAGKKFQVLLSYARREGIPEAEIQEAIRQAWDDVFTWSRDIVISRWKEEDIERRGPDYLIGPEPWMKYPIYE